MTHAYYGVCASAVSELPYTTRCLSLRRNNATGLAATGSVRTCQIVLHNALGDSTYVGVQNNVNAFRPLQLQMDRLTINLSGEEMLLFDRGVNVLIRGYCSGTGVPLQFTRPQCHLIGPCLEARVLYVHVKSFLINLNFSITVR